MYNMNSILVLIYVFAFTSIIDKTKYGVNRVRHKINAENWEKSGKCRKNITCAPFITEN